MIDVILYREKGEKQGYDFVQGGEAAMRYDCGRYTKFDCREPGRSIRFIKVGEDCFMLLYVVAVPEGNHHESRGQIISSGYLFDTKEADLLMSHPELILQLKYCKSADDLMEEEKINNWEQVRIKGKNRRNKQRTEAELPEELQKAYFTAVLTNTTEEINTLNTQVFHSLSDYTEDEAMWNLIRALYLVPVKIRKYISWNTNIKELEEAAHYEWNFLSKAVLEKIETSGFAEGRVVKRIILCDGGIISFQCQKSIDNAWTKYYGKLSGRMERGDEWPESREGFAARLLETENKDKRRAAGKNRVKARCISYKGIRNGDMKSRISVIVRAAVLVILTVWTTGAIRIAELGERTYTVSIHLDVFCAAGIFGIAYLLSSFLCEIKWKRRIRRLYQKLAGR